jgi:hypothetical protein
VDPRAPVQDSPAKRLSGRGSRQLDAVAGCFNYNRSIPAAIQIFAVASASDRRDATVLPGTCYCSCTPVSLENGFGHDTHSLVGGTVEATARDIFSSPDRDIQHGPRHHQRAKARTQTPAGGSHARDNRASATTTTNQPGHPTTPTRVLLLPHTR